MVIPVNNTESYTIDLSNWKEFEIEGKNLDHIAFGFSDSARGDKLSMEKNDIGIDLAPEYFNFILKLPKKQHYCKVWSNDDTKGYYNSPIGPLNSTFVNELTHTVQCKDDPSAWDRPSPGFKYADEDEEHFKWVQLQTCHDAAMALNSQSENQMLRGTDKCAAYAADTKNRDDLLDCLAQKDIHALPYHQFDKFIDNFADLNESGNIQMYVNDPSRGLVLNGNPALLPNRGMTDPNTSTDYHAFAQSEVVINNPEKRQKSMAGGQYMAAIASADGKPASQVVDWGFWPMTTSHEDIHGDKHDHG